MMDWLSRALFVRYEVNFYNKTINMCTVTLLGSTKIERYEAEIGVLCNDPR